MVMSTKKSRSAIIVILAALLMGGLSSAAWTFQEKRVPTSEEEKKRALDELAKKMQEGQQAAKPAATPFGQPQQPQLQPAPIPAAPIPAVPPAAGAAPRESGKVLLNLENADLYDFINQISSTLNLTPLVIDPEVKGTVNLSSGSISKEDILPLFNLILKNNNAVLIRQNGTYQVVPISSALKRGVEIIENLPPAPAAKPEMEQAPLPAPGTGNPPADVNNPASLLSVFRGMATQNAGKTNPTTTTPAGKQIEATPIAKPRREQAVRAKAALLPQAAAQAWRAQVIDRRGRRWRNGGHWRVQRGRPGHRQHSDNRPLSGWLQPRRVA